MLDLLRDSRLLMGSLNMMLRVRQVNSKPFNAVADLLSHGRIDDAVCVAFRLFGLRLVMVDSPTLLA